MIVLGEGTVEDLLALPVDRTRGFTIDDRHFTIIDSEFFYDICRKAGLVITDMREGIADDERQA